MGSTRLPGKVLLPLAGKPLLFHVVHRLRKCRMLDDIVIATSTAAQDDAIVEFAWDEGVTLFRGSELDVLSRFAEAAELHHADVVVRVNADAPLIDPDLTDRLVETLVERNADYVEPPLFAPCFHDGVDPMSRRVLERLSAEAGQDALAREHVSGYIKKHRNFCRIAEVELEPELQVEGPRLSIDTREDLAFFEALYARFGAAPGELELRDVAALYAPGTVRRA